jgi:hypothetical protein
MLENYKLEALYNGLAWLKKLEGINVKNVQTFTKILSDLEWFLIPYFDKRREITKKYLKTTEDGKQEIENQVALQEEIEVLARQTTDFKVEKINIIYSKWDKWFNVELNKALSDVYWDLYNLVEVE